MHRVGGDPGRPLLARPDLAATYQRRLPLYAGIATLTVIHRRPSPRGHQRGHPGPPGHANPPSNDLSAADPP